MTVFDGDPFAPHPPPHRRVGLAAFLYGPVPAAEPHIRRTPSLKADGRALAFDKNLFVVIATSNRSSSKAIMAASM
jgi:hypothetical protein